ncbi:MAG: heavy metal translocating P-type ATPase [Planctomycetaceae bacterium]|nr:heavy metal translocating P-type ATPase [Planctomycetaceae bacterium]
MVPPTEVSAAPLASASARRERTDVGSDTRTRVACAHCGDPVPKALRQPPGRNSFCCSGCEAVYGAIAASGLDTYYALQRRLEAKGRRARVTDKQYEEFDDPVFADLHTSDRGDGTLGVELFVENVHCGACVWLLERLPHLEPGVKSAQVQMKSGALRIVFDPGAVRLSHLARRLAAFGYPPHPARGRSADQLRRRETRRALQHIAVAGAIAGNTMVLAFPLYGGALHGIEAEYQRFFLYLSLGLAWVSVAFPGRTFFRGAFSAWRARTPHMDVPIAVGLGAGLLLSTYNALRGSSEVYFESLCVLVFLLLAGRFVQRRQQQRSQSAVELLFLATPSSARLVLGDERRQVPIEALLPGQVVEVLPGESLPVDGLVRAGSSHLDTKWLTGESRPVAVGPGDPVSAAAVNRTAPLQVECTAVGEATRVGRLMGLVETSAAREAPVVGLAHRIAGRFAVAVLVLAALTAAIWYQLDPIRALPNALALLIVTCPCALGLATPLAFVAAVGRAAQRGILVRGGDALESLVRAGDLVLDKTGTLTAGQPAVTEWIGERRLRGIAAELEACSAHPIARAFAPLGGGGERESTPVSEFTEHPGLGVEGRIEGSHYAVGSLRFAQARGFACSAELEAAAARMANRAATPIAVARDGGVLAIAAVEDPLLPDAKATLDGLRRVGWRIRIVSGDHPDVVRAVAQRLGLPEELCRGGVSPEAKLAAIEELRARAGKDPVVMVGDGVNDAAALAAATVGIAVHGGAEASLAAADVYLGRRGLAPLAELLAGARRTFRAIRTNVAVSLVYNATGVALAMTGHLDPIVAAVLMPLSSLTVIALSYRASTFPAGSLAPQTQTVSP